MKDMNWQGKTAFVLFVILFSSPVFPLAIRGQKKNDPLLGTWNSQGYGHQLQINKKRVALYDINSQACCFQLELPRSVFDQFYKLKKLSKDSLRIQSGFTSYRFYKLPPHVAPCTQAKKANRQQPQFNFDMLWQTFQENYAFFDLRGVDWRQSREKYRPLITSNTSDLELFHLFTKMLDELQDGHVSLDLPESLESQMTEEEEDYFSFLEKYNEGIRYKYQLQLNTYQQGLINWGWLSPKIAYLQINDFEDLAHYKIDQGLEGEAFWDAYEEIAESRPNYRQDVLQSTDSLFLHIFQLFASAQHLILDLRFNGGGFDEVGLQIFSHLIQEETKAFSKKARYRDGFTPLQAIYAKADDFYFPGKLYLLSSGQTASAAETFLLASLNLKDVTRIGSSSEGILSDILSKRLPNGWTYGLSNEVYVAIDGKVYEKIGIPVDYDLGYPRESQAFYQQIRQTIPNEDPAIEKALELIKESSN